MSNDADAREEFFSRTDGSLSACERYRTLVDAIGDGLYQLDPGGRFVAVNDVFAGMTGYAREDLLGSHVSLVLEEAGLARVEATVRGLRGSGADAATLDLPVATADGDAIPCELRVSVLAPDGQFRGTVGVVRDVDDRRAWEGEPAAVETRHDVLVEAVEEYAIFMLDPAGRVVTWNEGARRIKGYEEAEIVGEHFSTFYTDEDRRAGVPERNLAAAAEQDTFVEEGWRVRADGTRFWASVTITAVRDEAGTLQGYAKVTRDMTERRHAEVERELLQETIRDVGEAETFEEGLQAALGDVCELTDWEYAEAWLPTDGGTLRRARADHHDAALAGFAAHSEAFTFARDEGLPGRVWESGTFEWAADLSDESGLEDVRREEALAAGLRSALAVPVVADGDVVAVLVFAMEAVRETDEWLVELVSSVAAELGRLLARRRAERDLKRETELIERVFETTPVGLAVFDPDGEVVRANEEVADLLGLPPENVEAYTFGDRLFLDEAGEPLPLAERPVGRVLRTGEAVTGQELQLPTPDGSARWVSINATPITDRDGDLAQVVASATDVTRLKEQAQQLQRRREELAAELEDVFARVDDAFYALDEEMRFTHVNDRAAALLGHSGGELLGRTAWEALDVDPADPIRETFETAMATQTATSFERYSEPLGIWAEVRVYPSESGLSVYFTDVTGRKERERELEQYETIVETVNEGVYVVDEAGWFTWVNRAYAEMLGYDPGELVGAHVSTVVDEETVETARAVEAKLRSGDDAADVVEADLRTADGRTFPAAATFAMIPGEDGGDRRVGVVRDVTARKERERELEKSRNRYQALVDNFPNGAVGLVDEDLRYVTLGGTPLAEAGATTDELVGNRVEEVLPDELAGLLLPRYEAALDGEASTFERSTDDHTYEFRIIPVRDDDGDVFAALGMSQDVTERKERERALRDAKLQLEAATEAGAVGTWEWAVPDDEFVAGASFARTFGVDPEQAREGVSLDRFMSAIHDEDRDRVAAAIRAAVESCGEYEAEYRVRDADDEVRWVVARGRVECDDDGEPVTFPGALTDITERKRAELALERSRQRLAALDELNGVVRDITDAAIEQSTREEIERIVCERLAAVESYSFAWMAEVDSATDAMIPRVEAGVDGYLDAIPLSAASADPAGQGPVGRAVRTGETQVVQNAMTDATFEPWQEYAREYGYRSAAAIPVVHEGVLYGVLGVYADRLEAFAAEEREVVGHLGELVGHAIAAVERKRALTSDQVRELDFRIEDFFAELGVPAATDDRLVLDQVVPVGDGEYLVYGSTTGDGMETVNAIVETLPHWETVRVVGEGGDRTRFELRTSEPPVLTALAARGGYVEDAYIEDGDYYMRVQLPVDVDVRRVVDDVQEVYPVAEMRAQRQVARRDDGPSRVASAFEEELTDRQRTVLETAYFGGYFAWPRESSGEAVADALGIAPATFSQHLRAAENHVFGALFEGAAPR